MDVTYILDPLNETQREAVSAPPGHTLVLAGAGSGKTRVLVHRIAWLVETGAAMPNNLLAVTFTNKAAAEMRARIESMLNRSLGAMWVGTFHGLAHRMLRLHWKDTDLPEGFQILDSEDQLRMVRRVIRNLEMDETKWPPKQAQWFINAQKDEGLRARHLDDRNDPWLVRMRQVYQAYEEACRRSGLVDFAELLLKAHELLRERDDLLTHYQRRFSHLLVDELQDTNAIQYAWIRLMAGTDGQLFMVGDDDQSIYGWRGAKIENIHRFPDDFPQVRTLRLERNYRSTGNILAAANAVIANNESRLGKNLWTSDEAGEPIHLYVAFNEQEEAEFVADRIGQWIHEGGRRDDVAILYRVSAQSRVFEEKLLTNGIPYRVHGGLRFYERAEIKDALAYLRLMMNRHDDAAFERVINQPPRGIGMRTVEAVRAKSRAEGISLWAASESSIAGGELAPRATGAVAAFLRLINTLASDSQAGDDLAAGPASEMPQLYKLVDDTIQRSGLLQHYKTDKSDRAEARVENLEELVSAVRQFERDATTHQGSGQDGMTTSPLSAFLSHAALESGEGEAGEEAVHLMSFHAAKGLEFPMVFLCGLEEGLFPHQRNVSGEKLEEERRLCYVGMTRAEQCLYLSYAENRRLHGSDYYQRPSRFIAEIPDELVREVRARGARKRRDRFDAARFSGAGTAQTKKTPPLGRGMGADNTEPRWPPGRSVLHPSFGEGIILRYEGADDHTRVQVDFPKVGTKWLVLAYARLEAK
uniref:DNA 3'-5' helicase n=1 Tax=Candidatus Kentrum eta TaxID=2126337 RepID=A0A450V529_9GAMM|nr:MAG: ATP-dependent DNA helicase UvrD [Candidatus Kentron sp. H]VFJ93075.1 MAG: ATP-dependent DNA helicase UvrD [Candidatus Kentron sp. H]VFJ99924.1 MAG: ATP-dependent DNA helicase UvrD [Candidatus Kentron sp. H]